MSAQSGSEPTVRAPSSLSIRDPPHVQPATSTSRRHSGNEPWRPVGLPAFIKPINPRISGIDLQFLIDKDVFSLPDENIRQDIVDAYFLRAKTTNLEICRSSSGDDVAIMDHRPRPPMFRAVSVRPPATEKLARFYSSRATARSGSRNIYSDCD